ncbi:hypothetical protein [Achromobacter insolitus]|uniref:hypothetical protein n=1 Tax=Achromobacter insolitus TaxID=217204 RepID=UPI0020A52257|nr:hypothetical protein [Achromobacter insolitus]MCP1405686.1 hypothetical protein [Achromobacter insolitus]
MNCHVLYQGKVNLGRTSGPAGHHAADIAGHDDAGMPFGENDAAGTVKQFDRRALWIEDLVDAARRLARLHRYAVSMVRLEYAPLRSDDVGLEGMATNTFVAYYLCRRGMAWN